MEAEGGGEAEEEQVMSEVHLGCPPRFAGLYLSRFTYSPRPLGNGKLRRCAPLSVLRRISSYILRSCLRRVVLAFPDEMVGLSCAEV
jgi:hypothetical protein